MGDFGTALIEILKENKALKEDNKALKEGNRGLENRLFAIEEWLRHSLTDNESAKHILDLFFND